MRTHTASGDWGTELQQRAAQVTCCLAWWSRWHGCYSGAKTHGVSRISQYTHYAEVSSLGWTSDEDHALDLFKNSHSCLHGVLAVKALLKLLVWW